MNGGYHIGTRGGPGKKTLLAGQTSGHGFGIVGFNRYDVIHQIRVPKGRGIADANAFYFMRPGLTT